MMWRPISTAPRDGTRILLAFGSDAITAGWYEDNDADAHPWKFVDSGLCHGEFKSRNGLNGARDDKYGPTHWTTLPCFPAKNDVADRSGEAASASLATDTLPLPTADIEGLVERLEESAAAFRQHPIYTAAGDAVLLTVQAVELEEAIAALRALQAEDFKLAAGVCEHRLGNEHGNAYCEETGKLL